MSELPAIDDDDVRRIASRYRIGPPRHMAALTQGTVQTTVLLTTAHGRFVLRHYRQNRSYEAVVFEANLITYLRRHGFPCPAVVPDGHGKRVGLYKGRPYALFEFIAGTHIEHPDSRQRHELIQKVAELQNLTRHYRPSYAKYRWNYGVELCETLADDAARKLGTADAQAKLAWYRQELHTLALPPCLPKGICHCDFHFTNVLYRDGNFCAVLDFDDANYTYLTFDLAFLIEPFVPSFRWDTWDRSAHVAAVFDFAQARETVSAYQQYRALSPVEKKYFFDVYKLSVLVDCLWYFGRGQASGFYERAKIDHLNRLGREAFRQAVFGDVT